MRSGSLRPPLRFASDIKLVIFGGTLTLESSGTLDDLLLLQWTGPAGRTFGVESSPDLVAWAPVAATITEVSPGDYQGRFVKPTAAQRFYRVRSGG